MQNCLILSYKYCYHNLSRPLGWICGSRVPVAGRVLQLLKKRVCMYCLYMITPGFSLDPGLQMVVSEYMFARHRKYSPKKLDQSNLDCISLHASIRFVPTASELSLLIFTAACCQPTLALLSRAASVVHATMSSWLKDICTSERISIGHCGTPPTDQYCRNDLIF